MTPQTTDSKLAKTLQELLKGSIESILAYRGDLTIFIPKERIHETALLLRDHADLKFDQMMDLTAVDYLNQGYKHRFEVVYHFFSLELQHRLRVKLKIAADSVHVPSICDIWAAANWYERECYDMYGIIFDSHPNLKRILLYPEFIGHPLRKDYPIGQEQPLVKLKPVSERYNYSKAPSLEHE